MLAKRDGTLGNHRDCLFKIVSAPEFDPDSGQTKMGQIWVNSQKKAKTTPEPQGSEVVFSCRFFRKNSAIYTTDTAESRNCAGSIPQKGKRKPQVIKPGAFVIVDRFYWRIHLRRT